MIIAIDPGIDGAIVLMDPKSGDVTFYDMPVVAKAVGKGRQVCAAQFAAIISEGKWLPPLPGATTAVVELAGPTPQMGTTSAFSFGRSSGVIAGVLAALQVGTTYVRPQKWKKYFGLIGKDKDRSRTLAIAQHPELARHLTRKKDVDRAEALLMAHWYLETHARDGALRRSDPPRSKSTRRAPAKGRAAR